MPLQEVLDSQPDEELVKAYLTTGNRELIALLFERYTHLVFGICIKYLHNTDQCKDAVMDIFESLFHKLSVYHVENFRNWLYSVAKNHCLMIIRKDSNHVRAKERIMAETTEEEPHTWEDEEWGMDKNKLGMALDQLSADQGSCIRLMYLEQKTYKDIVEITGFTFNEVKSHIQNGKRNLKIILRNHGLATP